ncbi:hypothetical protein SPI_04362 [Niveomyces insectorum RCEF 264]|uniref:Uncharacterized protein n=1 Tax=Niveomyces insectorum RCEF 264 TaxID=1081102 RepID=A0A162J2D7_9HYPO|nr:hypothetical protein SPI_04362 [Niveomyces insectorum RCEF 264]
MPAEDKGGAGNDAPRNLVKGRLKPPKRNPAPPSYTQAPVFKNEMTLERPGSDSRPPAVEFCSTALPQPFVNPNAPLGRRAD